MPGLTIQPWKRRVLCCCTSSHSTQNKKEIEHQYCGCDEKEESKRRQHKLRQQTVAGDNSDMQTASDVDKTPLVPEGDELVEAIELDEEGLPTSLEPALPFCHEFKQALHPQSDFLIQGVVNDNAIRFAINFFLGRQERSDIAFHFNPRLDQLYTARNSRLNGEWGPEEGNSHQSFPFRRGEPFIIEIFLTHQNFLVGVNGAHYCSYTYRASLLNIFRLEIEGEVTLSRVHFHTSAIFPSPLPKDCPECQFHKVLNSDGTTVHDSQKTPLYGFLTSCLQPYSEIEISGKVKLLPHTFYVNLQEGGLIYPHPQIPLHLSVRFNQGGDHVILANSWDQSDRGGWGRELFTPTKCLFTPGYDFKLRITCQEDAFVARVDDQPLLSFKHRIPYKHIDTLLIQGDVFIKSIRVSL